MIDTTPILAISDILAARPWGALAAVAVAGGAVGIFALGLRLPALAPRWICSALKARPPLPLEGVTLRDALERLAGEFGLPEPRLLIVPHPQTNVFVLAGESGEPVLAVTEGALQSLGPHEAEAVVGAALARAVDPGLIRSTVAAGIGLMASHVAGLGAVSGAQAEAHPFGWPIGTPFILLGSAMSGALAGPPPGADADIRGAMISGRAHESARLLEHMEFTAHAAPMALSGAIARLALVDPLGERHPLSLARSFQAPPPAAPRAALLRGQSLTPDEPSCAQAA